MKVSNTIKKVVVLSVFCSQMLTLLPMQEIQPRPTRGLSAMSMTSELTFPGSVPEKEEVLPRDLDTDAVARKTRLNTLFYGEGDNVINIPNPFQDEQDPANLDEVTKVAISQDEDKDPNALAKQLKRKTELITRLSEISPAISVEIETKEQAAQSAPTQEEVDAKIEQVAQKKNEINTLIENTKQLMTKAKGHLIKGLENGAYLIAAANVVMILWSIIDAARYTETLPFVVYITDAAFIVLTATAQVLHAIHDKLKAEVGDEFLPEDHLGNTPQALLSHTERVKALLSNYWSKVTNCLSKVAATHILIGVAVSSAAITFVATRWPETVSPVAAQWIDNGENILDGLIIGWLVFSKAAINKLNKILAQKQIERRRSADGILHKDVELPTLPDRRTSLKPQVAIQIEPMHERKGSIEMVRSLPEESPIAMAVNPLGAMAIEIVAEAPTESGTPTPTKDSPEKRDSSERDSGNPTPTLPRRAVPTKLDFTQAELAI